MPTGPVKPCPLPPPEDTTGNYASADQGQQQFGSNPQYPDQTQAAYEDLEATQPPPELPEYKQPECPGDNYIWTPGYWNYAPAGYFWVPGVWVIAPYIGALWTPSYWGYDRDRYHFHHGFWGDHIGFYGGISYGYGYFGHGYEGGYWDHDRFFYNRAVTHVNDKVVHSIYVHDVRINNTTINNYNNAYAYNRVSYNGGRGGLDVRPAFYELAAERERHLEPLPAQVQHVQQARLERSQFAAINQGRTRAVGRIARYRGTYAANPARFLCRPLDCRDSVRESQQSAPDRRTEPRLRPTGTVPPRVRSSGSCC